MDRAAMDPKERKLGVGADEQVGALGEIRKTLLGAKKGLGKLLHLYLVPAS
jgi:hypothetical protein